MRTEADIDRAELLAHLQRQYDVAVAHIHFVPVGEGAWCYRADGPQPLFVRLAKRPIPTAALRLMKQLHDAGFPVIPLLVTRGGKLASKLGGMQLTVQPMFDGTSLMKRGDAGGRLHEQVGSLAARLHAMAAPAGLPVEDFRRYQRATRDVMDAQASGAFLALREAMRREIEQVLGAAESLGARIRERSVELVTCHGDLHDDNVLVRDDGDIRIIDWDGAMLAPRERDLMFFMGDAWDDCMSGYDRAQCIQVDRDILDYYVMEWALQEVVDYGSRILFDDRFDAGGKADALRQFGGLFEPGQDLDRAVHLVRVRH